VTGVDPMLLAEKAAAIERHLDRVAERLPASPADLQQMTDEADAVILHLWQAVQGIIDLAMSACVRLGLGTPKSYGEAFDRLAAAGHLDAALSQRLALAAGFRNLIAHAYGTLDMERVHAAATSGPADLRQFLAALAVLSR